MAGTAPSGPRPVLVVEIDVPTSLLHEGINTIACALVPGTAQRRIERAVSFLHTPAAPAARGRPAMPGARVPDVAPPALAAVLNARAVAQPRGAPKPGPVRQVWRNSWVEPLRERKKSLAAGHAKLKLELAATAMQQRATRQAIARGALRPKKP